MDGWNTSFLLGYPIFRGVHSLLVSGRVSYHEISFLQLDPACRCSGPWKSQQTKIKGACKQSAKPTKNNLKWLKKVWKTSIPTGTKGCVFLWFGNQALLTTYLPFLLGNHPQQEFWPQYWFIWSKHVSPCFLLLTLDTILEGRARCPPIIV